MILSGFVFGREIFGILDVILLRYELYFAQRRKDAKFKILIACVAMLLIKASPTVTGVKVKIVSNPALKGLGLQE